ncbi:MAG: Gram-negative bacterial tonB protein [Bacteroidota bacterium]|jgi:hypothetical protein|nr:Gram-negative bacterial tonB protein [Bacteroidota bacterium]
MKKTITTITLSIFTLTSNCQEKTSDLGKYYHLNGYGLQVPFGSHPIKTDPLENEAMTSVEFRYFPEKDVNSAYAIAILNSKQLDKIEDSIRELDYFAKVMKYTAETVMKGEMLIDKQSTYKNRLCYNQKLKFRDQETKEEFLMTNVLFYYKTNVIRAYVISTIKNEDNTKINAFFESIILQDEVINTDNNDEEIYTVIPIMPQLGDTKEALQEYIQKNSKLPTSITKTPTTKNVFLKVVIEKDGKVKFDKVMRGVSEKYDAEAKRIVENMPNWNPGQFESGKKGRTYMSFPIWFE